MGTTPPRRLPLLPLLLTLAVGCIPSRQGMGLISLPLPASGAPRQAASPPPPVAAPARAKSTPAPAAATLPEKSTSTTLVLPAPAAQAERASNYVQMSGAACEAELKRRGVPYESAAPAHGVDTPIRIKGPLRGVEIHEPGPQASWHQSVHEILDCRLALALDDFAEVLAAHDFVELIHVSFYRKNARIAGRGTPSQHSFGRAIDLSILVKRDGTRYDILKDWHGAIGDKACGPEASPPRQDTPGARELRTVACEAASRGIFHLILTPNFNHDHQNHLHIDIEPKRTHSDVK